MSFSPTVSIAAASVALSAASTSLAATRAARVSRAYGTHYAHDTDTNTDTDEEHNVPREEVYYDVRYEYISDSDDSVERPRYVECEVVHFKRTDMYFIRYKRRYMYRNPMTGLIYASRGPAQEGVLWQRSAKDAWALLDEFIDQEKSIEFLTRKE